jgi:hypothetical protein
VECHGGMKEEETEVYGKGINMQDESRCAPIS